MCPECARPDYQLGNERAESGLRGGVRNPWVTAKDSLQSNRFESTRSGGTIPV